METPPPPPPPLHYATPAPTGPIDLGRCFNEAIDVFKKNWFHLIVAAFLFELLSLCTLFILCGPLCGGIYLMCINALSTPDRRIDIGLMFSTFNRFGPLLGLFFLTLIPTLIGLVLFVAPGVLLMAMWMFAFPLMIDRNLGVTDSMSASWRIVLRRGFGWNLLLAAIIFVLALAPSLLLWPVNLVLGLVLAPITWLVVSSAYIQQVREREADLADILSPRGFPVQPNPATT